MISASSLEAVRNAPDRAARVAKMVHVMQDTVAAHGACQTHHLRAAGFTQGEIFTYADDARAIISGRPNAGRIITPAGRIEGKALVRAARKIRRRIEMRETPNG